MTQKNQVLKLQTMTSLDSRSKNIGGGLGSSSSSGSTVHISHSSVSFFCK